MPIGTTGLIALLGSAAIGAGGSIGAGFLGQSGQNDVGDILRSQTPTFNNPAFDTLPALNTLDLIASQGFFDPGIVSRAGPLNQAINVFRSDPKNQRFSEAANVVRGLQQRIANLQQAGIPLTEANIKEGFNNKFKGFFEAIAAAGGFGNLTSLINAQNEFEQNLPELISRTQQIAELSGQRRLDVEEQLSKLAGSPLPALEELRAAELSRINRDLDEQRQDVIRRANAGGYNPGRPLGDIEEFRAGEADLNAITRAIALLGGAASAQGQNINNLAALNPANRAQGLSPSVLQFNTPTSQGFVQGSNTSPLFAQGVGQASQTLANAGTSLGLLSLLNTPGPAAGAPSQGTFNQFSPAPNQVITPVFGISGT